MTSQKDSWFEKLLLALLGGALATILTTGCASSLEVTEDHLHAGRVDEALALIEKVRTRDTADPDAISMESKVRRQWLADKLIQVRLMRLAGNLEKSGDLLRDIIQRETQWSIMPVGAVFATQAEEVEFLASSIKNSIHEALQKTQPLLAASRLTRDRELLENTLKLDTRKLRLVIGNQMADFCKQESRGLTKYDHFHSHFLKTSCEHFKVSVPKSETMSSVILFSQLSPKFEIKGLSEDSYAELSQDLERDLKQEFEKSIWFDPNPKTNRKLEFNLSGTVSERIDERPVYRSRPFSVQIPYEERSVRKKEQRSGIGLIFEVLAWALGAGLPSSREEDNFDGTVTVYETKYRTETRYHTYLAKEVTQTLELDWMAKMKLQSSTLHSSTTQGPTVRHPANQDKGDEFQFKDQNKIVSDEHDVRFLDANLYPEKRKTIRPIEWLKTVNLKLLEKVNKELTVAWTNKFCDFQKEQVPLAESELHHRCLFGASGQVPQATAGWFLKRYGLEIETWRQLLTVPLWRQ